MATATPNILIKSISGRLGNVVFYTRRGKLCVRTYVIPRNPDTEAQRIVRRSFAEAVISWQSMTAEEQYIYKRKARHINMSGYNLYISKYLKRVMQAVSHIPIDELKLNVSPLTWNPGLSTLNLIPFPSVSKSYSKLYGINTYREPPKLLPG